MITRIAILAVMAVFYIAYFLKIIQQRREGINTMILGEGDKPQSEKTLEMRLKIISFILPVVEIMSIYWNLMELPSLWQWMGIGVAALGVMFFCAGMFTMKDSWRAGIPAKKETTLVTNGIYRVSRNPAFVGFDLLYLGVLIAFPNAWHACCVAAAIYLFHLQILNEENYLVRTFGEEYDQYKIRVRRYI